MRREIVKMIFAIIGLTIICYFSAKGKYQYAIRVLSLVSGVSGVGYLLYLLS